MTIGIPNELIFVPNDCFSYNYNCCFFFQTNVGPILLCVNPYRDVGNPLTLNSTRGLALSQQLNRVVQEAVRQQSETGYPQAIILSGEKIISATLIQFNYKLLTYVTRFLCLYSLLTLSD